MLLTAAAAAAAAWLLMVDLLCSMLQVVRLERAYETETAELRARLEAAQVSRQLQHGIRVATCPTASCTHEILSR